MNVPDGAEFFKAAEKLVGKDQLEISQALINFYFDGREFGYKEAKSLYKEVFHV